MLKKCGILTMTNGNLSLLSKSLYIKISSLIVISSFKVKKSGLCFFMLHFMFKFFGVNVLKKVEGFITIVNGTEVINKFSCSMTFACISWYKRNQIFNILLFDGTNLQGLFLLKWRCLKHLIPNLEKACFKLYSEKNCYSAPLDIHYTDDSENSTSVFFRNYKQKI